MKTFLHAACANSDKRRTTREFAHDIWREVRMDSDPAVRPNIVSSLLDMCMLENDSFDAVFAAHALERLYAHEVGKALTNIHRVLNQDGYLVLICADLQSACALVAEDKLLEPAYNAPAGPIAPIDIIYGFRPALAAGYERHASKCGFTARALMGTLAQAGFGAIWTARNAAAFTLMGLATKEEHTEDFLRELAAKHFG